MDKDTDGFETLLRPVRDAITTNWEKTIKSYLEKYLDHLCGLHNTNFSEAALILQNSMKFYCKRIDLLYNDLLNFIMYMNDNGSREEGVVNQTSKKGKRCVVKSFHNDDLQVLGFVHSEQNSNINLENIGKGGLGKKSVVLNPSVKIPIKTGTACQIYQSDEKELGYKDEFRLFWPTSCKGLLSEDFNSKDQSLIRAAGSILEDSTHNDNTSCFMNDNLSEDNRSDIMDLEPEIPDQHDVNDPSLRPISPTFSQPPPPATIRSLNQKKNKRENIKVKPVDWGPISFNFVIPLKKLGVKRVFRLPKQLIVDVFEGRKKRKRKSEFIDGGNEVILMGHILYENEILNNTCDGLKIKCNIAKKNKKVLIKNSFKGIMLNGVEMNDDDPDVLSDDGHADDDAYHESDISDKSLVILNNLNDVAEEPNRIDAATSYLDAAMHVIAKYRAIKKIISSKSTELTKRVSEWHESIMPALEAAESRSIFHVHEYGTQILDKFSDDDNQTAMDFGTFVRNQPKEEICRFLLSSLMLANTYNVEIIKSEKTELAKDCLQLRLLSKVRHHEVLNENIGATTADSHC